MLKSKRLPIDSDWVEDGGSHNAFRVTEALLAAGAPVVGYVRREPGQEAVTRRGALTIYRVDCVRSRASAPLQRDLEEARAFGAAVAAHPHFKPGEFRVVHTHHWTAGVGLLEALGASVRLVHTPHLLAAEKVRHLGLPCPVNVLAAEAELLRRATAIITLSAAEASAVRDHYGIPSARVSVIPNGVGEWFFDSPIGRRSPDRLHVVSIGRLCRQKGVDVLLEAINLLASDLRVELTLVGSPYDEPVVEEAVRHASAGRLHGRLTLAGHVPNHQLGALLARADIYVQASRYESQGIAVLEAMAAGCAVVASDLPAIREYLAHGVNGLLTPIGDAAGLARAIDGLALEPTRRIALGEAARATARGYSWAIAMANTIALLSPANGP